MRFRFSEETVVVREGGAYRKTCCGACGQVVTPLLRTVNITKCKR